MSAVLLPASEIQLRELSLEDVPRLAAIESRAYLSGWTAGIFADCLRVGYQAWGLSARGELFGYGLISVAAGESHLLNLAIDPPYQRQGHGKRLLRHLFQVALDKHAACMFLEVRPSNLSARRLYGKAGFRQLGRRTDYYPAPTQQGREDALVLWCNDLKSALKGI